MNGSPSSSVDPFLLDFGTSVNVTEDLRREIRTEIQEIDKKIQTGLNENKQEQRLAGQLQQDLSHAQCEMRNLSRGAADRLDDAGVHASFLNGLETSLHTDLVTSTGPLPGCRSPVSVLSAGDARSMPPTSGTSKKATKKKTNKQVLGEKREIVKKLVQSFQEQSKIGETRRREKETLLQQKQQIEDTIRTGGLESILEQSKQKNEHSQVDVKNESHRQQHLKEKMQSVRGKCGEHGQKLADKVKSYQLFDELSLLCFILTSFMYATSIYRRRKSMEHEIKMLRNKKASRSKWQKSRCRSRNRSRAYPMPSRAML